jgi:oligoribonuclease NrnB/cAMP/cGMP phosphodiesterase (DHH superfamily)
MTRAGCVLTWETLFRGSREVPELLLYVQDRDLWKWELPQSKEVSAALSSYPLTFTSWDEIIHEKGIKELAKEGEAILRYINTKVYETANSEYSLIRMAGYLVPAVCTRHYHSEIGNKVVTDTDYPFCVTYYDDGTNSRVFSLRSLQSGADVANVAKQYGGGGHAQAAGFKMPTPAAIRLFFNNTVKLSDIEITDMKTKHALVMKTSAALNYVIENGTVKDVSNFGDETITVEGDGTLTITLKLPNNYSVTTTVPKNGWRWRK